MKKNRKSIRRRGKLFFMPDLEDRLLEKATRLVEAKRHDEARRLFGELLAFDEEDIRGLYGWAICSVELGEYREAEKAVVCLLEHDTPYFQDVFRLYLTILIEKKDYRQALIEISRVAGDARFGKEMRGFLKQMRKFCEKRLDEPEHAPVQTRAHSDGETEKKRQITVDRDALKSGDPVQMMGLVRKLAAQVNQESVQEVRRLLLEESENQEIKTVLMCALKESHLVEAIKIRRFGKVYPVQFDSPQFLYKTFADKMCDLIERVLGSENPTLAEMAAELGRLFMMNVYPMPLDPPSVPAWAAVFSIRAATVGELNDQEEHFRSLFDVHPEDLRKAFRMVDEIESYGGLL